MVSGSRQELIEAQRIEQRTRYDVEMLREVGTCKGIENYSRHITGLPRGSRPYTLIDYIPDDFLIIIDESHVMLPQLRAMYAGDRSRKQSLVDYGFRLPSALDNRPLKFEEFNELIHQIVYVSATPAAYEREQSGGISAEQIIRPTGLLDPVIETAQHRRSDGSSYRRDQPRYGTRGTNAGHYTDEENGGESDGLPDQCRDQSAAICILKSIRWSEWRYCVICDWVFLMCWLE